MADDPAPYVLKHPITATIGNETQTIHQVTMRRATGADLLLIDQYQHQPMMLVLEMIGQLSGLMMVHVKKLDAEDLGPLGARAFSNIEGGPPIGETA